MRPIMILECIYLRVVQYILVGYLPLQQHVIQVLQFLRYLRVLTQQNKSSVSCLNLLMSPRFVANVLLTFEEAANKFISSI